MADDTNRYLLSIVAVVAITGLFLLYGQDTPTSADGTTGLAVGYNPALGDGPTFDEEGNKICTGRVNGNEIVPDYIKGCHGTHMRIKDWAMLPPAVKAYYNHKQVAYKQVAQGNPAYDWPTDVKGAGIRTVKASKETGGSGLPDQTTTNEVEIVEVFGAAGQGRSVSTLV
ncbi:MAG: hypothetical protein Q7R76_04145 [Candidatus Woesearchaeota archaeon]|nr:hypothetical protein [Candidatus Woesearchaeota archaeon]